MYLFYSQSGRSRFQLTVDQGIPSRRFTIGDISATCLGSGINLLCRTDSNLVVKNLLRMKYNPEPS